MTSTVTPLRTAQVGGSRLADSPKRRILLIDDEPELSKLIAAALTRAEYAVDCAATGGDGLACAAVTEYDLVLLDLVIPDLDGRVVLKRLLAERPERAVLVLSSLSDVTAKVECFELGAHDYLTKPFAVDELIARVRVQLRGRGHPEILRNGGLTLDLWRLQADSGRGPVPLTRLEFLLLRELMEHAGKSVPKDRLLASVWGYDFNPHSNVVDVCVGRLRTKLGFDLIRTVRGAGYQLAGASRRCWDADPRCVEPPGSGRTTARPHPRP
ncbi:MAG TPA: response regulator transcription factor [Streptosporangiaceae bacterium]|jgi:DNA-binding response OmpR family regulator